MEQPPTCPVCGSAAARTLPYPAAPGGTPLGFREIAICSGCGLGVALPRLEQPALDAYYRSGAYWEGGADNPLQSAHEKSQSELRVEYCAGLLRPTQALAVLDVGAGHGWTAEWLHQHLPGKLARFDFVEPDDGKAAAILRRRVDFRVSRLGGLDEAHPRYDLVFLNHVLEHVADPVALTRRIADLLADDGIAYVEMPNSDYRFKDDVSPHTLFFTREALARLAARAQVAQLRCEEFGRWLPAKGAPGYLPSRLLLKAFSYAARGAPWPLQRGLDRAIWRYERRSDGIWLRWVFGPRR
jgi:2-polyprenyl-3-methyl-5-hydroxy-6-metoxy-1,4-benzoquinol methylase